MPSPAEPAPVFVHSSFRTGSTWLWSRFRAEAAALAYCEIFHEGHATRSPEQAAGEGAATWRSRHPEVEGYYREFIPLLRPEGGVRGYAPSMAFGGFVPGGDGRLPPDQRGYVAGLIAHARAQGKVPVLTATRSLGRVAALRAAFGGVHVVLWRNLFRQWASYTDQWLAGNSYFLDTIGYSLAGARDDPALAALGPLLAGGTDARRPETFRAMLLLHAVLLSRAAPAADMVLDLDALAADPDRRSAAERELRERSGLAIDLSSARATMTFSIVDAGPGEALERELEREAAGLGLTGAGREALAAAVAAYAAYRESNGALMQALPLRLAAMERAGQDRMARLRAEAGQLRDEIGRREAKLATLQAGMAKLRAELAAAQADAERARTEADRLRHEIDAMLGSRSWRATEPLRLAGAAWRRVARGG